MLKIDMHTHILPEKLPYFAQSFGYGDFIRLVHHRPGFARMMQGEKFFMEVEANSWDAELRIEEYNQKKTQVQVVCTIPIMFSYWAKPAHTLALSKFLNDDIAQLVHNYPKQYVGLGTVPMQDTRLAIQELERCKEIGLVGIQIGSNINDRNLSEPQFFAIFEACEELEMAVFVHPWNIMGASSLDRYQLPWIVGMPAEASRAICSMVFSGIFEKLPNLRCNFAHSGGSFLATIGRIEHAFKRNPKDVAADNPVNPREYLGKFWVDCLTHDPVMLKYVLDTIGPNRVTLGSNYPFQLGDPEIGTFIEKANLSDRTVEAIFCDNTLEWLDLDKKNFL